MLLNQVTERLKAMPANDIVSQTLLLDLLQANLFIALFPFRLVLYQDSRSGIQVFYC